MITRKTKDGYRFTAQNKKDSNDLLKLMKTLSGEDCEEDCEEDHKISEDKDNVPE